MTPDDELLDRLCRAAGVHLSHADAFGKATAPSREARIGVLRDFGLWDDPHGSLMRLEAQAQALAPEWAVVESETTIALALRGLEPGAGVAFEIALEQGGALAGENAASPEGFLALPPLPIGYHRLTMRGGGRAAQCLLLAAPARCWQPPALEGDRRLWGVSAQTYGLRSARNQGFGDFADIAELCRRAAPLGADFVGMSPAHALYPANRGWISPYSPSSRMFLDPIYLDIAAPDGPALADLRAATLIDHAAVWRLKLPLLEAAFESAKPHLPQEFHDFCMAGGEPLRRFGVYETLFEHFYAQGLTWLNAWPAPFRDCASPAVEAFARENLDRVQFHLWLQWLCDGQLATAQAAAKAAGMGIGLYRDLAVGSDRGGAEVWTQPGAHAPTLSIGAPPDALAPQGQNWGLPPLDPLRLVTTGFAAFREPIVANMRHAGALRVDHAFQLSRLFLIPPDVAPGDGAYVDYPFEPMLAVLRIESARAGCAVIAEDLGTAPPGFSQRLMETGISGCCVMPFERDYDGGFKPPQNYPRQALAMSSTHDLPTFIGWWRGRDIDWRHDLGIFDFVATLGFHATRRREIADMTRALHKEGLLKSDAPPSDAPLDAATAFLARARAALAALQLEDAAGEVEQANLPGTVSGHPNWRRRLGMNLDELFAPDGPMARLARVFAQEGRGAPET